MQIHCVLNTASGGIEITSSALHAAALSHFYAAMCAPNQTQSSREGLSAGKCGHWLLSMASVKPTATSQALAVVSVPSTHTTGFKIDPGAGEASLHITMANMPAAGAALTSLKVASKIGAASLVALPSLGAVWTSSLAIGQGTASAHRLVTSCGNPVLEVQDVETRELGLGSDDTQAIVLPIAAATALSSATPATILMAADPGALQLLVAEAVETIVGAEVGPDQPLMEAGLDSLGATELQQKLATLMGLELPSTLVFDYPTVTAMAGFLSASLAGVQTSVQLNQRVVGIDGGKAGAVAIVGAAGQATLLQRAAPGDDTIRVPANRWGIDDPLDDGSLAAQVSKYVLDRHTNAAMALVLIIGPLIINLISMTGKTIHAKGIHGHY
jgi:acyl carrier protein